MKNRRRDRPTMAHVAGRGTEGAGGLAKAEEGFWGGVG